MSRASTNSGLAGVALYPTGSSPRTRDWSRDNEVAPAKPRCVSEQERLADIYLAAHERRQQEARDEEQRKEAADRAERERRRQDNLRAQREADLKRRRAECEMQDRLIDDCFQRYAITLAEKDIVTQALLDGGYTPERAEILCGEIVARRPKPKVIPYGMVEVGEEDF
jgi:hypothetical protein